MTLPNGQMTTMSPPDERPPNRGGSVIAACVIALVAVLLIAVCCLCVVNRNQQVKEAVIEEEDDVLEVEVERPRKNRRRRRNPDAERGSAAGAARTAPVAARQLATEAAIAAVATEGTGPVATTSQQQQLKTGASGPSQSLTAPKKTMSRTQLLKLFKNDAMSTHSGAAANLAPATRPQAGASLNQAFLTREDVRQGTQTEEEYAEEMQQLQDTMITNFLPTSTATALQQAGNVAAPSGGAVTTERRQQQAALGQNFGDDAAVLLDEDEAAEVNAAFRDAAVDGYGIANAYMLGPQDFAEPLEQSMDTAIKGSMQLDSVFSALRGGNMSNTLMIPHLVQNNATEMYHQAKQRMMDAEAIAADGPEFVV